MSNQMNNQTQKQNVCGCCGGLTVHTPAEISNRPGQAAISYRAGTHARFKASMLSQLSGSQAAHIFKSLKTREADDFTIALLDAWAVVSDVLTFYQERIANESYLRTATERLSLLYLARLIGYELRPGVSASTYLAFKLDQQPGEITLAAGTKVQSVPEEDELPQLFESAVEIVARPEWNEIRPRLAQPQTLSTEMKAITVKGAVNNIKPGDRLLIVVSESERTLKRIISVKENPANNNTLINLSTAEPVLPTYQPPTLQPSQFSTIPTSLTGAFIATKILNTSWNSANLAAMAAVQKWPIKSIGANIAAQQKVPKLEPNTGVFVFRKRAALFGHNAPKWSALPSEQRTGTGAPYTLNWDSPALKPSTDPKSFTNGIYLDNTYPNIVTNSWLILEEAGKEPNIYQVAGNSETTRSDFTLSTKVSAITLDSNDKLNNFTVRGTTVHAESEALTLDDIPIPNDIAGDSVTLDGFYDGLEGGMNVIVTGERVNLPGVIESEAKTVKDVLFEDGYTTLKFEKALANSYVRKTVTLTANVAPANHGERRNEVLGSGDGRLKNQSFGLKFNPLSYTSAATSTGGQSTLEIRVNDILWREVDNFYNTGPEERAYITRLDDDGLTTVTFGDGVNGARVPTGQLNVTATYRQGTGSAANLGPNRLTVLAQKPLGLREATNPIAAAGGADAESRDNARQNAPLTVMTLDRIVSLKDYEDFARAFSGIAKALATWTWSGQQQGVFVTVAGDDGADVLEGSDTHDALLAAMRAAGDPYVPLVVASYQPVWFQIEGKIKVHADYVFEKVRDEVAAELRNYFSFNAREFGQDVTFSEVMRVIHSVRGVTAADLDALYLSGSDVEENQRLVAGVPEPLRSGTVKAAELLLLDPRPIILTEMT